MVLRKLEIQVRTKETRALSLFPDKEYGQSPGNKMSWEDHPGNAQTHGHGFLSETPTAKEIIQDPQVTATMDTPETGCRIRGSPGQLP